jgi:hypothetical protein
MPDWLWFSLLLVACYGLWVMFARGQTPPCTKEDKK